jgi:hypothetical protein
MDRLAFYSRRASTAECVQTKLCHSFQPLLIVAKEEFAFDLIGFQKWDPFKNKFHRLRVLPSSTGDLANKRSEIFLFFN